MAGCPAPRHLICIEGVEPKMFYTMNVAGLKRDLPLCRVNDDLYIGAFVIFGDVELTVACARELLKIAPEHDILITAESKGIPLVYEMARQHGENRYLIARKAAKLYMKNVFSTEVTSITTENRQMLCIDQDDADFMARQARPDCGRRDLHRRVPQGRRKAGQAGRRQRGRQNGHSGRGRRAGSPRHPLPRKAPPLQSRRLHQRLTGAEWRRKSWFQKPGVHGNARRAFSAAKTHQTAQPAEAWTVLFFEKRNWQ